MFESIPYSINLPPDANYQNVVLTGVPKEVGEIEINGYSTHTLGVKSNCRLKSISNVPESTYHVQVIPSMPCMETLILDSNSDNISSVTLFAGERYLNNYRQLYFDTIIIT